MQPPGPSQKIRFLQGTLPSPMYCLIKSYITFLKLQGFKFLLHLFSLVCRVLFYSTLSCSQCHLLSLFSLFTIYRKYPLPFKPSVKSLTQLESTSVSSGASEGFHCSCPGAGASSERSGTKIVPHKFTLLRGICGDSGSNPREGEPLEAAESQPVKKSSKQVSYPGVPPLNH